MTEARTRRIWWNAIYLLVALLVLYAFMHWFNTLFRVRAYPGYNVRPYVARVLIPWSASKIDELTPERAKQAVLDVLGAPGLVLEFAPRFQPTYYMFVMYLLSGIGFLLFGHAIKETYRHYYGPKYAPITGILAMLSLPLMFKYYNHTYDAGTVALAALSLLACAKRQRWLFAIVFILWCFHRETAIMALGVYAVAWWKHQPKWATILETAVFGVMFLGIYRFIAGYFETFPGGLWEWHLLDHQALLLTKYLVPFIQALFVYAIFFWLIKDNWKLKPGVPKAGLVFIGIPLFTMSIFFGFVDELRALYDFYPHALILALPSLMHRLGLSEAAGSSLVERDASALSAPDRSFA